MQRHPGIGTGIAQLLAGGFVLAVHVAIFLLFRSDMAVFTFYIWLLAGAALLAGTLAALTVYHGIRNIAPVRPSKFTPATHLVLALVIATCAIAGLLAGIVATVSNFGMVVEDLGTAFAGTIAALLLGSLAGLAISTTEHALAARGKPSLATRLFDRGGRGESARVPGRHATAIGKLQGVMLLVVVAGAGAAYGITELLKPPNCFNGVHGFSEPAYDLAVVLAGPRFNPVLDDPGRVNQTILAAFEEALWTMTRTQDMGGFPLKAEVDGSRFYGDRGTGCPYHPGEFSLQDGTPVAAGAYLAMYRVEPNPVYLQVAEAAAGALLAVQDAENGGFFYDGRRYPDGRGYQPHPTNLRRAAVFDDNVMQSAVSFLIDVYNVTGNATYMDAVTRALGYVLALERTGGGWPQRSNYHPEEYPSRTTLNDNAMRDIVRLLLKAHVQFGNTSYLAAAERAGQFLIRVQGNGGSPMQQGWAQQYENDLPAWARKFEPPAMATGDGTISAMNILLDLYLATGNETYLEPFPAAIAYLNDTNSTFPDPRVPGGAGDLVWSRLYELGTNRWIVGNRATGGPGGTPEYFYDYDPVRDAGYTWFGTFGIPGMFTTWAKLQELNNDTAQFLAWRDAVPSAASLENSARSALAAIHASGFWLDDGRIDSSTFASNALKVIRYLANA